LKGEIVIAFLDLTVLFTPGNQKLTGRGMQARKYAKDKGNNLLREEGELSFSSGFDSLSRPM